MRQIQPWGVLAMLVVAATLTGCGGSEAPAANAEAVTPEVTTPASTAALPSNEPSTRRVSASAGQDIQVRLKTSAGDIVIRLFPDKAPRTVENFLDYARDGFYEGTVVHHAEAGLVIAGGCDADLQLKPTRFPILNEANNGLANRRGTIAMARLPESAHSATSQFFINLTENPAFNHQGESDAAFGYCVFGEVISGLEIAEQIGKQPTGPQGDFTSVPRQAVVIQGVEDVGYMAGTQANVPLMR